MGLGHWDLWHGRASVKQYAFIRDFTWSLHWVLMNLLNFSWVVWRLAGRQRNTSQQFWARGPSGTRSTLQLPLIIAPSFIMRCNSRHFYLIKHFKYLKQILNEITKLDTKDDDILNFYWFLMDFTSWIPIISMSSWMCLLTLQPSSKNKTKFKRKPNPKQNKETKQNRIRNKIKKQSKKWEREKNLFVGAIVWPVESHSLPSL